MGTPHALRSRRPDPRETLDRMMAGPRSLPSLLGTSFVDITSAMAALPHDSGYAMDLIHMGPLGHRVAAREILEYLAARHAARRSPRPATSRRGRNTRLGKRPPDYPSGMCARR